MITSLPIYLRTNYMRDVRSVPGINVTDNMHLCYRNLPTIKFYGKHHKVKKSTVVLGGARWRSWLRHYATNRNVAGSIPDGDIGINSLT
jgi:hypothetical protein